MNQNNFLECELYCIITNNGLGNKVMRIAKENGITGGTTLIGKGTVKSGLLNFLGIDDVRKEIVLMATTKEIGDKALLAIYERMNMHKPHRGIGFSLSLKQIFGSRLHCVNNKKEEGIKMDYNLIMTIVEKGNADRVIDAAVSAGSKGGTIISGRGSGVHETQKIFNIEIEPEKEIVMILAKKSVTDNITSYIRKELDIDEPGKGIIFVLDVTQTYGLYEGK